MSEALPPHPSGSMPRWVWKAVAAFWVGYLLAIRADSFVANLYGLLLLLLVSMFLALAIEPGVNRLQTAVGAGALRPALILVGVLVAFIVFVVAIGALVGQQVADLLRDSETYVTRFVDFLNGTFGTHFDPTQVIDAIKDEDGAVQRFIRSQSGRVVDLSVAALGALVQALSVSLFTFYLVADAPRLRRAICRHLSPERQQRVLDTWQLAIDKTGGYLYSRALLAGASALSHWVVLQALGTKAPLALALWVGVVSQFLPVVGTYLAAALPLVVALIDSPTKALVLLVFVLVYQQVENYVLLPRITARTMDLHPAIAFGAAIAGGAVLGPVGALLAIPAAAMVQALLGEASAGSDVIDHPLLEVRTATSKAERKLARRAHPTSGERGND